VATLREIRRRISGVKSTQKITKAMKMVAAAKLRRAQEAILAARPYARTMRKLLGNLALAAPSGSSPLFEKREVHRSVVVVVTGDRGLCGAFNSNVIRAAADHIKKLTAPGSGAPVEVRVVVVGKKGADHFGKRGFDIAARHVGIFGNLQFPTAQSVARVFVGAGTAFTLALDVKRHAFEEVAKAVFLALKEGEIGPIAIGRGIAK